MALNLRQLEYFVAVAEELHFTRAAARLHMAQPPLSQQIKRLEADLGMTLLHRNRRAVRLTREGAVLLDRARRLLAQARDLELFMERASSGHVGVLRIGYVGSACYETLPRVVQAYRAEFPEIELRLVESGTGPQMDALIADDLDIGFVRPPLDDSRLTFMPLIEEPLLAVLPETHPLAGGDITVADLRDEPFIMHQRRLGAGLHDEILALCRRAGFSPRVVQETGDMQAILSLVSAGVGIGLVPASMASITRPRVVYRGIPRSDVRLKMGLARRLTDESPAVMEFIRIAQTEMAAPLR